MNDDKGRSVKKAGPSIPVEILGLSEVPEGGDVFYAVDDERKAREVVEARKFKEKQERQKKATAISLDNLFEQIEAGKMKDLNIIVKADVQGSGSHWSGSRTMRYGSILSTAQSARSPSPM